MTVIIRSASPHSQSRILRIHYCFAADFDRSEAFPPAETVRSNRANAI